MTKTSVTATEVVEEIPHLDEVIMSKEDAFFDEDDILSSQLGENENNQHDGRAKRKLVFGGGLLLLVVLVVVLIGVVSSGGSGSASQTQEEHHAAAGHPHNNNNNHHRPTTTTTTTEVETTTETIQEEIKEKGHHLIQEVLAETQEKHCDPFFVCQEHHAGFLAHSHHLPIGTALCSGNGNRRFGLTKQGKLIAKDCRNNKTTLIQNFSHELAHGPDVYFELSPEGNVQVHQLRKASGKVKELWKSSTTCKVLQDDKCEAHASLECPLVHLQNNGHLVMNWVDDHGKMKEERMDLASSCFDDFFPQSRRLRN